ncbi:aminotransferase class V-fold PLP-dependent enzyme [Paraburkholderia sp. HP33-1]|uniref:aminotransferase class V-fold PLP-dependent enzyme n=1 Tax=Paraburkholderia sp. HP33-1 TaxID=2883243 RepID=UPI001F3A970F|nr:aminotransferase class V-fold PLP-dependent enzyme [Paraburkholderia sp. HP33-1]
MNVETSSSSDLSGERFWENVRAAYPMQQPLMNLNNAAVSPPPIVVEQATIDAYRFVSRNPDVNMWSKLDAALPSVKEQLAALADCSPEEIALNRNSSEGLSTVIFGLPLSAGDQVLISEWDYPSARAAWMQRQQRERITVASVDFDVMGSDDEIVRAYEEAMTSSTRVILLTHMLHWTGRLLPVKRICELARERKIITIVDGAQTFAQMPVSFRDLDCDFFITSLHKWLCAPVGNGMLIVRANRIDETWPLLAPFDTPPLRIDKFDHWNLGTYNSALQAGIAPALEFHRKIGPTKIHARLKELSHYWIELAHHIPGFTLHTPLNADLGAVSLFSIANVDSRKVEQALLERHQIHVKYRQARHIEGLRVSPHIYMLKTDMNAFVSALAQVVHTSRG